MQLSKRIQKHGSAIYSSLINRIRAFQSKELAPSGQFLGLNGHTASGSVSITKSDVGYEVVFSDDFTFIDAANSKSMSVDDDDINSDGIAEPKVVFGKDGKFDSNTLIDALRSNTGKQSFAVPSTIDVSLFNEIYLWSDKSAKGLGVATIK